jgi:multiple antibiotic resistance protein
MPSESAHGFIAIAIRLFFLLTPFFVLSSFLALTREDSSERTRLALRTTGAIAVTCLVLYFFGTVIFDAVGITLDAFRIGAGGLLFLSAVALVRGGGDVRTREAHEDVSVVPLAIPIAIGPATTGALMVMGAEDSGTERLLGSMAILAAVAATGALLLAASAVERLLGRRGITVLSKLTGLMLAAMAAQLLCAGVRGLMKG